MPHLPSGPEPEAATGQLDPGGGLQRCGGLRPHPRGDPVTPGPLAKANPGPYRECLLTG